MLTMKRVNSKSYGPNNHFDKFKTLHSLDFTKGVNGL